MKKSLLAMASAVIGCAAFAADYTWKGGSGNWTDASKWETTASGYPSSADAVVKFNGDANVTLDTGVQTDIAYIDVTAGSVVLANATSGSSLKINWLGDGNPRSFSGSRGLTVAGGASLEIAVPLATMDGRFDRMGTGKLTIRDIAVTKTGGPNWYFYNGTNSFEGSASVTLASNSDVVFGVGNPVDRSFVFIKDNAQFSVCSFNLSSGGTTVPNTKVVQDGAGTVVAASNVLKLDCNSANDGHCYTLKSGTLSADNLSIGAANAYVSPDYAPEHLHYIQEGGTSTFAKVTLARGSAALRGGVMNLSNQTNLVIGGDCLFDFAGGTLALTDEAVMWNWAQPKFRFTPGSSIAVKGSSTLAFDKSCSTYDLGLEIGEGKTVTIGANAAVTAPLGSTNSWKVTLDDGSVLKLANSTARLFAPLDLTVNGTGKILFTDFRGAAVARKLTVNGVEKAKGRYSASGNSFVDGDGASSIFVPTVWTGNGGNNLWSNPANWDDGVVPNGSTAVADVSGATSITLDTDVSLTALIANPNRALRTVTISGAGSIALYTATGYDNGLFVPEGCELILDVNFRRGNNDTVQGLYGGGRVTFSKDVTVCKNGGGIIWAIDGTFALNGATVSPYSGSTIYCNFWTQNGAPGEVLIEDGTTFAATRVWQSLPGYTPLNAVRQTGGTASFTDLWLTCYYAGVADRNNYILEGGELTVANAIWFAPGTSVSSTLRHPGGSFEMSGGTLTCGGFKSGKNQNYARLYGGTINLNGNMEAQVYQPEKIANIVTNDISYYLGGVTIHPVGGQRNLSSGNAYLTGRNGDVRFDLSERDFAFSSGNTVSGPGGIVVSGGAGRKIYSSAAFTFTGAMTVKSGGINFYESSSVNGPSALIVENTDSSVYFGNGAAKAFDRIVLVQVSNLSVNQNKTITTKRLVVGGADVAAGTYTGVYGSGTVVVTGSAPASWVVNGVGDLSWYADGTTTTADAATTLSSLAYAPIAEGKTNTLTGATLTFSDGANIHVEKGSTLVIGNDVVFAGKITKTGWGEVVFNGGVTSAVTPAANTDRYWLTVLEGGATFDGAVTGVRLMTCGSVDADLPPVITLNENCTVSNYGIVLTAWNEADVACRGETHQNGATVDCSTTVFDDLIYNRSMWALTQPRRGGYGRYVLDSGEFRAHASFHLSFLLSSSDAGTFEFVQNGGTFSVPKSFFFARATSGVKFTYTLNDGRFEFGGSLSCYEDRSLNFINLNGGTYVVNGSDIIKREALTLTTSGTVTFEVASGKTLTIRNDGIGEVSLVKTGEGSLVLDGAFDLNGLDVQGGTLTLKDKILPMLDGTAALSVAKTATLNLDYDGEVAFKTLKVGNLGRAAGIYSATQGSNAVKRVLDGDGELRILEGSDPGTVITIH